MSEIKIDYELLMKQRDHLVEILMANESTSVEVKTEVLDGVVNLLDSFIDTKDIKRVCAVTYDSNGEPDIVQFKFYGSQQEFDCGDHLGEALRYALRDQGYDSDDYVGFDEDDKLFSFLKCDDLFSWNDIEPQTIESKATLAVKLV